MRPRAISTSGDTRLRDAIIAWAAITVVGAPILWEMAQQAASDFNYSQNLLYPIIGAALLYIARERFAAVSRESGGANADWRAGVIGAVAMVALAGAAFAFEKYTTARYMLMLAYIGVGMWKFGADALRKAWGPALLLLLTVPMHKGVVEGLIKPATAWERAMTTEWATGLSNMMGVAVWSEGYNLHLAEGILNVDITCSGMGYVVSLLVIGIAVIYTGSGGAFSGIGTMLAAIPAGIVANTARVVANVVVCDARGVEEGLRFFHDAGGVIFAATALLEMLVIAAVLNRIEYIVIFAKEINGDNQ